MPYLAPPRSVEGVISLNGFGRGMIGSKPTIAPKRDPRIRSSRRYATTPLPRSIPSLPALVRLLPRSSGITGSHIADLFY
jgi:hypothetical protein